MARQLKILFVASEVVPFAKTGGLADVAGALPQTLKELGHEVRVMMPKYGVISDRKFKLHDVIRLKDIPVPVGSETKMASVKVGQIAESRVQVYFLDNKAYFGGEGLYGNATTGQDYPNNDERFIFFCRGVLETLKRLGWQPDVIHLNDWQTALVATYLRTIYRDDPFFANIRLLYTIHNLAYQGVFPAESFAKTNLPPQAYATEGLEFYGKLNFMKAGLLHADALSTVSRTYAKEIQTAEAGAGLEGVLAARSADLHGIVNGIDYTIWNPAKDKLIAATYTAENLAGKAECKAALQGRMGLPVEPTLPLVGMVSRLTEGKGFDLIVAGMERLLGLGVQVALLGAGSPELQSALKALAAKHSTQFRPIFGYDNDLAHQIQAGADLFLMPSHYEPCGLNQLYSLRYGTIPVVRATGGLVDTVQDVSQPDGDGFAFKPYTVDAMVEAVSRAVEMYRDEPEQWAETMKRGMARDYSWLASAGKYVELYEHILSAPPRPS